MSKEQQAKINDLLTVAAIRKYLQDTRAKRNAQWMARHVKKQAAIAALLLFCLPLFAGPIIPIERLANWSNHVGKVNLLTSATQTVASATWPVWKVLATNITTAQMNTEIANCPANQKIKLTNGTYTATSAIEIQRHDILVEGMGWYVSETQGTRIATAASFGDQMVFYVGNNYELETSLNYTTGQVNVTNALQNSQSLTTMQNHGWSIGDKILIDQKTNLLGANLYMSSVGYVGRDSGTRPVGHFAQVTAVPTLNTATIVPPIILPFSNSLTPMAIKLANWVTNIGVESLTIDTLATTGDDGEKPFQLVGVADSWIYNVECIGIYDRATWSYGTFRFTIQNNKFYGNRPVGVDFDSQYTSERAYGPYLGPHNTGVLIADNIFEKLTLATAFEGCSSGNAFVYNFCTNIYWMSTDGGNTEAKINFSPLMHGPCPTYNLVEGNIIEGRWRSDILFGNSGWFTIHKNRIRPRDRRNLPTRNVIFQWYAVELERYNRNYNFVDNIIGSGVEIDYEHDCDIFDDYGSNPGVDCRTTIWKTGHPYNSTSSANSDPEVLATTIRWGNYDTLNDARMNHATVYVGDTNTPTSVDSYLYLSKPAWFGNRQWPPIVPTQKEQYYATNVPAVARYYGINIFAESSEGTTNTQSSSMSGRTTMTGSATLK